MAYTGRPPAAAPLTSGDIPDGSVTAADLTNPLTKDAAAVQTLNRTTSDGDIQVFQKDGSAVGSIGTYGGDIYVGTGDTGVRFVDSLDCLLPLNTTTAASRDNGIDIGQSETRFKDVYLSGGVYLGAPSSVTPVAANYLDDYEEGQFDSPSPTGQSGGTINFLSSRNRLSYIKIGNQVTVRGYLEVYSVTGTLSGGFVTFGGGLPFAAADLTEYAENTAGSCDVAASGFANWAPVALTVLSGGTDFYIYNSTHLGNWMTATANGTGIRLCFSYQAA